MARYISEEELACLREEAALSHQRTEEFKCCHKAAEHRVRNALILLFSCFGVIIVLEAIGETGVLPWMVINSGEWIFLGGVAISLLMVKQATNAFSSRSSE